MREDWRRDQTVADYPLTKGRIRMAPDPCFFMTEQHHIGHFIPAGDNEILKLLSNECVILEDYRTRQALIDDLSVGENMAERTGKFDIRHGPVWTARQSPAHVVIDLRLGPCGQSATTVDADENLCIDA